VSFAELMRGFATAATVAMVHLRSVVAMPPSNGCFFVLGCRDRDDNGFDIFKPLATRFVNHKASCRGPLTVILSFRYIIHTLLTGGRTHEAS
jgi:hypothetical protein